MDRSWLWIILFLTLATPVRGADLAPVKLGLVVPSASDAGPAAQSMRRAAEMAVADWAPRLDREVLLKVQEDPFDPKQAVAVAEKLVQDGTWGVVGHFYSSSSIPASAIYYQAGIPLVTPTSTHPRLTRQGFTTVFRVSGRDDQQALTAAAFILDVLKGRRIAVVHDRTEYGRSLAEALTRAVQARFPRRLVAAEVIAQGDKDFAPLSARLKAVEPDVVYFGGIYREAAYLVRQLRQARVAAAFVSGDGVPDPEFLKIAGEETVGRVYCTFAPDPRLLPSARLLIQRYEARYGSLGPYVLYTYDAVGVLLRAIQIARPKDHTKEELRKVVRAIRGMTYDGALGRLRWDRNGDLAASPYVVYATKKGGGLHGWFEQLPIRPAAGGAAPRVAARPSGTQP